jgi:hypothetical protein
VGAAVAGAVIVGVALSTRGEAGTCLDVPASQCRLLGGP